MLDVSTGSSTNESDVASIKKVSNAVPTQLARLREILIVDVLAVKVVSSVSARNAALTGLTFGARSLLIALGSATQPGFGHLIRRWARVMERRMWNWW